MKEYSFSQKNQNYIRNYITLKYAFARDKPQPADLKAHGSKLWTSELLFVVAGDARGLGPDLPIALLFGLKLLV